MYVTKHARKRLKERNGINKRSVDRMAEKALNDGIRHNQTKGNLNKWLTGIYFRNTAINNLRVYGDKVYLFHDDRLVTVMQIPSSITRNMKSMIKENE